MECSQVCLQLYSSFKQLVLLYLDFSYLHDLLNYLFAWSTLLELAHFHSFDLQHLILILQRISFYSLHNLINDFVLIYLSIQLLKDQNQLVLCVRSHLREHSLAWDHDEWYSMNADIQQLKLSQQCRISQSVHLNDHNFSRFTRNHLHSCNQVQNTSNYQN